MTRVVITGGPRTGKTTLASSMAREFIAASGHSTCNHCRAAGGRFAETSGVGRWPDPCPVCGMLPLVRHTDDTMGRFGWSEGSAEVARWMDEPGPWIVEGVAASRALRKWRDLHPDQPPPADRVIFLTMPHDLRTKGQASMAKGVETVHAEIEEWLAAHGVATERP